MGKNNMLLVAVATAIILGNMPALGRDIPPQPINSSPTIQGGPCDLAKSETDTLLLMGPWGSGAPYNGQFEDSAGKPDPTKWSETGRTTAGRMSLRENISSRHVQDGKFEFVK